MSQALCLTLYIFNPLTREVGITTSDLQLSHSSHPEPFSFLTKLFQAPLLTQGRMSCSFPQSSESVGACVGLQGHVCQETFPVLSHLPMPGRMDSFAPHATLYNFQNYTYHLITRASFHACLPRLQFKRFKERDCATSFS